MKILLRNSAVALGCLIGVFATSSTAVAAQRVTVAQAIQLPDETAVSVSGQFTQAVPGEEDEFIFRDSTGQVLVYVAKAPLRSEVTIGRQVVIFGRVDRENPSLPEIELDRIEAAGRNAGGGGQGAPVDLRVIKPNRLDVTTNRGRIVIRGTARNATNLQVRAGSAQIVRKIVRLPRWKAVVRLPERDRIVVRIRANGPGGSETERVIIRRG